MRRDMDLVRAILFRIEAQEHYDDQIEISFDNYDADTVGYHVGLLKQAGFVEANDDRAHGGGPSYIIIGLTWNGHEFLEAARDDTRWNKAKSIVAKNGGGMVVSVLTQLLNDLLKQGVQGVIGP